MQTSRTYLRAVQHNQWSGIGYLAKVSMRRPKRCCQFALRIEPIQAIWSYLLSGHTVYSKHNYEPICQEQGFVMYQTIGHRETDRNSHKYKCSRVNVRSKEGAWIFAYLIWWKMSPPPDVAMILGHLFIGGRGRMSGRISRNFVKFSG